MAQVLDTSRLSDEEKALYERADEDLLKEAGVYSFDLEQFWKRVRGRPRGQQLLQAHLYFDHVLTQLLSEALVDPDAVNMRGMGFAQKLNLIQAMGLLPGELVISIEKINSLRNKIAHDLNFELSDDHIRDFANVTPNELREVVWEGKKKRVGLICFVELLIVVLVITESQRQSNVYKRLKSRKHDIHMRLAIENARRVLENTRHVLKETGSTSDNMSR